MRIRRTNNMKNKRIILISGLISLFAISSLAFAGKRNIEKASAYEDISLSSNQDAFKLLDKQYDEDESFVYTADLNFRSGQAGGLAFGSEENDHYYVVNMDRNENHVKLIYFASNGEGGYTPTELRSDYFIGNDKMTLNEENFVKSKVRTITNVNLKVILTREDEHAYFEFYVEGIKRFGVDNVIDLNDLGTTYTYQGRFFSSVSYNYVVVNGPGISG